jgi:hypothetical protein
MPMPPVRSHPRQRQHPHWQTPAAHHVHTWLDRILVAHAGLETGVRASWAGFNLAADAGTIINKKIQNIHTPEATESALSGKERLS